MVFLGPGVMVWGRLSTGVTKGLLEGGSQWQLQKHVPPLGTQMGE